MKTRKTTALGRRQFLGALGAGAGAAAMAGGTLAGSAQTAAGQADPKGAASLKIVDFHNHYVGPAFALTNMAPAAPTPCW